MRWRHFSCKRIDKAVEEWVSTPYRPNTQVKQQGADCLRLVAGILDDLFETPHPTPLPVVPQSVGLHDRRRAMRSIHIMLGNWFSADAVVDDSIEPGDIAVTRSSPNIPGLPANPGHAMFVTSHPFTVLHTTPNLGAHLLDIENAREILRIYRPRRKDLWTTKPQN